MIGAGFPLLGYTLQREDPIGLTVCSPRRHSMSQMRTSMLTPALRIRIISSRLNPAC